MFHIISTHKPLWLHVAPDTRYTQSHTRMPRTAPSRSLCRIITAKNNSLDKEQRASVCCVASDGPTTIAWGKGERRHRRINRIECVYGLACVVVVDTTYASGPGAHMRRDIARNIEKQLIKHSHKSRSKFIIINHRRPFSAICFQAGEKLKRTGQVHPMIGEK